MPQQGPPNNTITFRGAKIVFKNFGGAPTRFSKGGKRTFGLCIEPEMARAMEADDWNIRWPKPRENQEDDLWPTVEVEAPFDRGRPPKIVMITSRGQTRLTAATVGNLDHALFTKCDVIIRARHWDDGGQHRIKAYLDTMYVTIYENELDREYAADADLEPGDIVESDEPPFDVEPTH